MLTVPEYYDLVKHMNARHAECTDMGTTDANMAADFDRITQYEDCYDVDQSDSPSLWPIDTKRQYGIDA